MNAAAAALRRDVKVISLIGVAHFLSHVYQLALPALFLIIHDVEGLSFAKLGILSSVFFVVSAIFQAPAGFLADRIGARPVLIGGMLLISGASALFGLTNSFELMLVLSAAAGLGNSVFHPADFSILNGSVSETRIGRGLSIHGFGGYVGYAATPFCMFTLGTLIGWQEAMLSIGLAGLIVTLLLRVMRGDLRDSVVDKGFKPQGLSKDLNTLFQAPAVLSFTFFAFMAMGSIGMMTFGASTLHQLLSVAKDDANLIISLQLAGAMAGTLIGGVIADRTTRHDFMTAIVVTLGVVILMFVPIFQMKAVYALLPFFVMYGVMYGIAGPMRDMVVRSIAPSGSAGKVFGFTYSGMDVGSAVATFLFGYILSMGMAVWNFVFVAIFMMMGVSCVLFAKIASRKSSDPVTA